MCNITGALRKLNRILLSQVYKPYLQQQEQIKFLIRNNVYIDKQEHPGNPPSSLYNSNHCATIKIFYHLVSRMVSDDKNSLILTCNVPVSFFTLKTSTNVSIIITNLQHDMQIYYQDVYQIRAELPVTWKSQGISFPQKSQGI